MGAGTPNYQRLAEMGKLPPDMAKKLPHLAGLDEHVKELTRLREGMCESCKRKLYPAIFGKQEDDAEEKTQLKCDVPGCHVMAGGNTETEARNKLEEHKAQVHPVAPKPPQPQTPKQPEAKTTPQPPAQTTPQPRATASNPQNTGGNDGKPSGNSTQGSGAGK